MSYSEDSEKGGQRGYLCYCLRMSSRSPLVIASGNANLGDSEQEAAVFRRNQNVTIRPLILRWPTACLRKELQSNCKSAA